MYGILPLPKELEDIARADLNEVPNRVKEDIDYIRMWLLKQHQIRARTDDETLLIFLRSCKFSLEKTKKKICLFYAVKSAFPDMFKNRDPLQRINQHVFDRKVTAILPTTPNGPLTVLVRLDKLDPEVVTMNDSLRTALIVLDVFLRRYVNSTVVGISLIVDVKNLSLKHVTQLTPQFLKKAVMCLENAYPLRIKSFHVVNLPTFMVSMANVFKSFLSSKLQKRVFFHSPDCEKGIVQHFDPSILPTEYGGHLLSREIFNNELKSEVESYRSWFLEDEQYRSMEDKTSLCSKLNMDLFSFEGSFRKLEID